MANGVVGNTTSPGQVAVTQQTYDGIVLQQLTELWTRYGALEEIWYDHTSPGLTPTQPAAPPSLHPADLARRLLLSRCALARFDGGYNGDQLSALQKLLVAHQPHAAIFNGCQDDGQCVSNTSVRWIGTESGQAPDPNWSTGVSNDGGDPDSPIFCPAECDTTLQENDRWFWVRHRTVHSALRSVLQPSIR